MKILMSMLMLTCIGYAEYNITDPERRAYILKNGADPDRCEDFIATFDNGEEQEVTVCKPLNKKGK